MVKGPCNIAVYWVVGEVPEYSILWQIQKYKCVVHMCFVSFPKVDGVSVKLDKVGKRRKVTARWDTLCFHHPQHCVLQIIIITLPTKMASW